MEKIITSLVLVALLCVSSTVAQGPLDSLRDQAGSALPNMSQQSIQSMRSAMDDIMARIQDYRQTLMNELSSITSRLPSAQSIASMPELSRLQDEIAKAREMINNPLSGSMNTQNLANMFNRMSQQMGQ